MVGYIFYKDDDDNVHQECFINETAFARGIEEYRKNKTRFIALASPTNISLPAHYHFTDDLISEF